MLWKPSTSNSLWDSRRMPNLPDVPPALTRSSNFEYEASPAGPVQGAAAAKAKPIVAHGQGAPSAAPVSGACLGISYLFSWNGMTYSSKPLISKFMKHLHFSCHC